MGVTWVAMLSLGINQAVSGVLSGSTGFGGAVISQLLWGFEGEIVHDPFVGNLKVLLGCLQIGNALSFLILFAKRKHWRFIRWEYVIAFGPGMALLNPLGTYVLTTKPPDLLKQTLGLVFIVISTLQVTLRILRSSPGKAARSSAASLKTGGSGDDGDAAQLQCCLATEPACEHRPAADCDCDRKDALPGRPDGKSDAVTPQVPVLADVIADASHHTCTPAIAPLSEKPTSDGCPSNKAEADALGAGRAGDHVVLRTADDDNEDVIDVGGGDAAQTEDVEPVTQAGAGMHSSQTRSQRVRAWCGDAWRVSKRFAREKLFHWHILVAVVVGCISGFLWGLFGTPGPPIILYISVVGGMEKGEVRATYVFLTMLTFPIAVATAVNFGVYQASLWPLYLLTVIVGVCSYLAGKWLHNRINVDILMVMILALVWFSGLAFIRIFDPNTLTWVGLGLALISLLIMGSAYFLVRYRKARSVGRPSVRPSDAVEGSSAAVVSAGAPSVSQSAQAGLAEPQPEPRHQQHV